MSTVDAAAAVCAVALATSMVSLPLPYPIPGAIMGVAATSNGGGSEVASLYSASFFYVLDDFVAARIVDRCVKSCVLAMSKRQALSFAVSSVCTWTEHNLMRFDQVNNLEPAKALGDVMVMSINPTVEIMAHTDPPVMTGLERLMADESVMWVDGDENSVEMNWRDVYAAVKVHGHCRTVKQTGWSSTLCDGRCCAPTTVI